MRSERQIGIPQELEGGFRYATTYYYDNWRDVGGAEVAETRALNYAKDQRREGSFKWLSGEVEFKAVADVLDERKNLRGDTVPKTFAVRVYIRPASSTESSSDKK